MLKVGQSQAFRLWNVEWREFSLRVIDDVRWAKRSHGCTSVFYGTYRRDERAGIWWGAGTVLERVSSSSANNDAIYFKKVGWML